MHLMVPPTVAAGVEWMERHVQALVVAGWKREKAVTFDLTGCVGDCDCAPSTGYGDRYC